MHSLEQIYHNYAQPVYRYCFALTRRADLAEELTQEVFCEAVRCIGRYDGSCKLLVWLCQIAKHKWLDWQKKQKHRAPQGFDELELQAEEQAAPSTLVEQREEVARVYRCIRRLPPEQRELVRLRAMGGLSFREIGQMTGQTENAARVGFYRAKSKLTRWLEEEEV